MHIALAPLTTISIPILTLNNSYLNQCQHMIELTFLMSLCHQNKQILHLHQFVEWATSKLHDPILLHCLHAKCLNNIIILPHLFMRQPTLNQLCQNTTNALVYASIRCIQRIARHASLTIVKPATCIPSFNAVLQIVQSGFTKPAFQA